MQAAVVSKNLEKLLCVIYVQTLDKFALYAVFADSWSNESRL